MDPEIHYELSLINADALHIPAILCEKIVMVVHRSPKYSPDQVIEPEITYDTAVIVVSDHNRISF